MNKQGQLTTSNHNMEQNNNEAIVFDMLEEVATESIAEARNAYTYEEIDGCYEEAKSIALKAKYALAKEIRKGSFL